MSQCGQCHKIEPLWKGDEGRRTESECTSSYEVYEHNVGSLALGVIGQNWSSKVVSLFLEDWARARVTLMCHMALDFLCQEMRDPCQDSSLSQCSQKTEDTLTLERL